MISQTVLNALNKQINKEFYSSYLYLSMANYFSSKGFYGFSKWMIAQAEEEKSHALDFYHYIKSRNSRVELFEIDSPPEIWDSPRDVFNEALKHEEAVTGLIKNANRTANEAEDTATLIFLEKYVKEQVQEENMFTEIVHKLDIFDDDKMALYMLDKDLGKREE